MLIEKGQLFIDGEWIDRQEYYELKSPHTNEVISKISLAQPVDVEAAVGSAKNAAKVMKKLTKLERSNILEKVSKLFEKRFDECVKALIFENAKPIKAAQGEVLRTIETYKFAAEEAKKVSGETIPMDAAAGGKDKFAFTKKEPLGVIGAITPFNFPFNLVAHKLGPAFAMGNAVVLKPASQTPLSAIITTEIFEEAGLPKGALNLVFGGGGDVGEQLVTHPDIKMITFTGSVEVGRGIKEKAGLKKVTLELGSNSAVVIDSVDDMSTVAKRCVEGAFSYSGQTCISVQRIYVQEALYEEFLRTFLENAKTIRAGNPQLESSTVSSLIRNKEADRIESWIEEAKQEDSAEIILGGTREGALIHPTIITNVSPQANISQKEAFAPVVVVNKYTNFEEAIDLVNDSSYGLQAGVYTKDVNKAFMSINELEVGGVIVNDIPSFRVDQMPYGGVKESGTGREGIKYSMEEMCELKLGVFNFVN